MKIKGVIESFKPVKEFVAQQPVLGQGYTVHTPIQSMVWEQLK